MTKTYFPFDSGAGANVTEVQWGEMAQFFMGTGVISTELDRFYVYGDSSGMQVKVKSGVAWVKGHYFKSDVEEVLPIAQADSTNPRIDRVVIRLNRTADLIELAVLQGVPAVSPVAPALTQNSSRWEVPLAQVQVGNGVSTISSSAVTKDERNFPDIKPCVVIGSPTTPMAANTATLIPFLNNLAVIQNENLIWDSVNKRILAGETGVYLVSLNLYVSGVADGNRVWVDLYLNGSLLHLLGSAYSATASGSLVVNGTVIVYMEKGNYLQFYSNGSSTYTISTNSRLSTIRLV